MHLSHDGKLPKRRKLNLKPHHIAWLACHPRRTAEWLAEKLAEDFHVHHIDGDHSNDDPRNLVLIEGLDHMLLFHGMNNYTAAREAGRKGAIALHSKRTPEQRSKAARRAAKKRWRAVRQGEAHKKRNAEARA